MRISVGGALSSGPRKIARKPASSRRVSQPNAYQVWPTLTIDRYSAQSAAQASIETTVGALSTIPARAEPAIATPVHATTTNRRSE